MQVYIEPMMNEYCNLMSGFHHYTTEDQNLMCMVTGVAS